MKSRTIGGTIHLPVSIDTHTVMVDVRYVKRRAILEFLSEVENRVGSLSGENRDRLMAVAIGVFDIKLSDVYGKEFAFPEMSDAMLSDVVRYKIDRNKLEL